MDEHPAADIDSRMVDDPVRAAEPDGYQAGRCRFLDFFPRMAQGVSFYESVYLFHVFVIRIVFRHIVSVASVHFPDDAVASCIYPFLVDARKTAKACAVAM